MSSIKKNWIIIKISNNAKRNIKALDPKFREEIRKRFRSLQENPFGGNVKTIIGKKNIYRERIGNYRFYFKLVPHSRQIHILLFDYKGRIKNKTIQRLE